MTDVCPQTPKVSSGLKLPSLPNKACSSTSKSVYKARDDDDIPDLGLDDTPLLNNSIPPTPNDLPLAHVFSISQDSQSSPSKFAESRSAAKALHRSDIISDNDSLTAEEYLQQDGWLSQPAGWLSKLYKNDAPAAKKSWSIMGSSGECSVMGKNLDVFDLNFSKQITIRERRSTESSYCAKTRLKNSPTTGDSEAFRSPAFSCTGELANSLINGQSNDHSVSAELRELCTTSAKHMKIKTTLESGSLHSRHTLSESCTLSSKGGNLTLESAQPSLVQPAKLSRNLDRIMPYDAFRRLNQDPTQCISTITRRPYRRCEKRTKMTQDGIDRLKQMIKDNDDLSDLEGAEPLIRDIIKLAMCSGSHIKLANGCLTKLLHYISGETTDMDDRTKIQDRLSSLDVNAIGDWIDVSLKPFTSSEYEYRSDEQYLSTYRASTKFQLDSGGLERQTLIQFETTQAPRITRSTNSARKPVTRKGDQPKLTVWSSTAIKQIFEPYTWPRKNFGLSVESIVGSMLVKPLTPVQEMKDGYIYVYWIPGNFGYIKIGVTTRNSDARLKEWKQKCGHEIGTHDILGAGMTDKSELIAIPHVHRVEKLIHAELLSCRLQELGCVGCGVKHNEWFQVHTEHAKKVIRKWARWMKREIPYELRTTPGARAAARSCLTKAKKNAYKPTWELKELISDETIESISKPIDIPLGGQLLVSDRNHDRPKTPLSGRRTSNSTPRRSPVKKIPLNFGVKTESKVKIEIEGAVHIDNV